MSGVEIPVDPREAFLKNFLMGVEEIQVDYVNQPLRQRVILLKPNQLRDFERL